MSSDPSPFLADPGLLQALARLSASLNCDEDRILFRQGEPCFGLFILLIGEATLEMRSDQCELIFQFQTPGGSLLGLPAVVANQPYSLTATASKGSLVRFLNSPDAIDLLASDPAMSLKALQVIGAETRAARMEMAAFMVGRKPRNKRGSNGH